MILKKIGVMSLAKVYGSLMAVTGFLLGLFLALFSILIPNVSGTGSFYGPMGVWAVIWLPIFYGLLGFVAGAFSAGVYNLIAKRVGGLELDFDKK
ncbi:MAG: hypothetical protein AABW58_04805 [Nanoarchaeota archaeon]